MNARLNLLSIASVALADTDPKDEAFLHEWEALGRELGELLHERNGFYAFESALLVRPVSSKDPPLGLVQWNASNLWKKDYSVDLRSALFFAEDVFGTQFCIAKHRVQSFNPETAEFTEISVTLVEWCDYLLEKHRVRTGHPLAHEWQERHGPLPAGQRLLPRVPFVLGGQYSLENLYASNDVAGMLFRASIANQIKDVPDGGQVRLKVGH